MLVLLPSLPVPADAGARIRNAAVLDALRERHQVDVLAFGDETRPQAHAPGQVTLVKPPAARSTARRLLDVARSQRPDMALRLWSSDMAVRVDHRAYDVVQAEGLEMARYLSSVPPAKRIYDAHNAEFLLQRRFADSSTSLAGRLYSRLQWRRLARFEAGVVRDSRLTLAVSEHDANQLRALAGDQVTVEVVPNAIAVDAFPFLPPPDRPAVDAVPEMLFVGKYDFRPNADAVRWLLVHVLPALDARLFAVGGAPPAWLVRAGQHSSRIAVTGYVADERTYLQRCSTLVLPLRTGGGSRLKALVALASGLPIVSTLVGMEGLEAEPDVHYLHAESADEWIAALRRLWSDVAVQQRLARAGRALVESRYDTAALRRRLIEVYDWLA